MIRISQLGTRIGLALGLLLVPAGEAERPSAYETTMRGAVERAQAELERSVVLWQDHSTWETAWNVSTGHYRVRMTGSRRVVHDVAVGLETMLGHFRTFLGSDYRPTEPVQVLVFPNLNAYTDFGEAHGAEHSSFYGGFYASGHEDLPVATYDSGDAIRLRRWTTHCAVHQFLEQAYSATPPTWVAEGLASYFALLWDYPRGVSGLARTRARGDYIPLDRLLTEPIEQYTNDDSDVRFIELGMLFNYLLNVREDTRTVVEDGAVVQSPFADYLRSVLAGRDVSNTPVHALLVSRWRQLESDFTDWGDRESSG